LSRCQLLGNCYGFDPYLLYLYCGDLGYCCCNYFSDFDSLDNHHHRRHHDHRQLQNLRGHRCPDPTNRTHPRLRRCSRHFYSCSCYCCCYYYCCCCCCCCCCCRRCTPLHCLLVHLLQQQNFGRVAIIKYKYKSENVASA
jgi:hypothetical protein